MQCACVYWVIDEREHVNSYGCLSLSLSLSPFSSIIHFVHISVRWFKDFRQLKVSLIVFCCLRLLVYSPFSIDFGAKLSGCMVVCGVVLYVSLHNFLTSSSSASLSFSHLLSCSFMSLHLASPLQSFSDIVQRTCLVEITRNAKHVR